MHTFGDLIQSDFRIPSQDYSDLMKAILILRGDHREVLEGIRQMVFNVLMHNRDDHVKDFSFLYDDQELQWHLSPAYDLMLTEGIRGEHTMSIAGEARLPGFKDLLQVAESASVSKKGLSSIIEEVSEAVRSFPDFALSSGVPQEEVSRIYSSLSAIRL